MKTRFAAAAIACCLLATLVLAQDEVASAGPDVQQTIRHVVLFEFKEDAPADKIREIEAAFAARLRARSTRWPTWSGAPTTAPRG